VRGASLGLAGGLVPSADESIAKVARPYRPRRPPSRAGVGVVERGAWVVWSARPARAGDRAGIQAGDVSREASEDRGRVGP